MDQQFCDCRPVLLIRRHLQIELHCANDPIAAHVPLFPFTHYPFRFAVFSYPFVKTCYEYSTCPGAHLRQNFVDPERASLIDRERREEAYRSEERRVGKEWRYGW